MDTIKVIKITNEEQYGQALAIRKVVFVEEQNVPVEIEIDENEAVATHVLAYDENETPVATGRIRPYAEGVGKMERIAVLQEVRSGRGYGRAIMDKLEAIGRELGFRKFVLEAQIHAEKFYEKLGYTTISEPFMEAGIVHVKMEKDA
ncbi:MAG: GNAT family N-acetyltransferase [Tumebacillaceae bacterium]